MTRSDKTIYALSFVIAAAGFLLPLWPLCVLGIVLAALAGRWIFAVVTGLLIDLAWGAPYGLLHAVHVPFTLLAVVLSLARYFLAGYFFDRGPSDTL